MSVSMVGLISSLVVMPVSMAVRPADSLAVVLLPDSVPLDSIRSGALNMNLLMLLALRVVFQMRHSSR